MATAALKSGAVLRNGLPSESGVVAAVAITVHLLLSCFRSSAFTLFDINGWSVAKITGLLVFGLFQ